MSTPRTTADVFVLNRGLVGPEAYSPEWYALRVYDPEVSRDPPFVLGASVAGVICGLSKYSTPLQLYHEMRGNVEISAQSERMYWGKQLEPVVLDEFEKRHEVTTNRVQRLYLDPTQTYIGATPDALYVDDGELISVDAKCTTSRMYRTYEADLHDCFGPGEDEVPSDYVMQAQQQMLVTGAVRCDLPVLFDGNHMRIYSVGRNDELIAQLRGRLEKFYAAVLEGQEPEVDWEHDTTVSLMKNLYGIDEELAVDMAPEELQWYEQWVEARDDIKEATARKDEAQARLLHAMRESHVMHIPEHNVSLVRSQTPDSLWTEVDVVKAQNSLGSVKRRGFVRLTQRKDK